MWKALFTERTPHADDEAKLKQTLQKKKLRAQIKPTTDEQKPSRTILPVTECDAGAQLTRCSFCPRCKTTPQIWTVSPISLLPPTDLEFLLLKPERQVSTSQAAERHCPPESKIQ